MNEENPQRAKIMLARAFGIAECLCILENALDNLSKKENENVEYN